MPKDKYLTCALYKFATLSKYQEMREPLRKKMKSCNVFGTILLANEGINGTISGNSEDVISVVDWLEDNEDIGKLEIKRSYSDEIPFYRTKVKLKKEIVTMGIEDLDPSKSAGQYVEPEEWNKLISNPNVLIIDTRNEYEVSIGTFVNSVNPGLSSFRDFPNRRITALIVSVVYKSNARVHGARRIFVWADEVFLCFCRPRVPFVQQRLFFARFSRPQ